MHFIGFGCSFTYGSELQSPDLDPTDHWANTRYREQHAWLGQLAKRFDCKFQNLAQPANSNFAISQQVIEYLRTEQDYSNIIILVAWTERTRMSWYDDHWTHNGFVSQKAGWVASCKEWVIRQTSQTHDMYTENAKFLVNYACSGVGVKLLQFNALGKHKNLPYQNYLLNGSTMDDYLKSKQIEFERNYFASDMHPNEEGHLAWTTFMSDWIEGNNLI